MRETDTYTHTLQNHPPKCRYMLLKWITKIFKNKKNLKKEKNSRDKKKFTNLLDLSPLTIHSSLASNRRFCACPTEFCTTRVFGAWKTSTSARCSAGGLMLLSATHLYTPMSSTVTKCMGSTLLCTGEGGSLASKYRWEMTRRRVLENAF